MANAGYPFLLTPFLAARTLKHKLFGSDFQKKEDKVLWHMMSEGANFYVCIVWYLRGFYAIRSTYPNAKFYKLNDVSFPTREASELIGDVNFIFGQDDFDAPERKMNSVYRFLYWAMEHARMPYPDNEGFRSIEAYKAMLKDVFQDTFVPLRPIELQPDDPMLPVIYATHDFASDTLRKVGDRFVCDMSHYEDMETRDDSSYERFGGKLSFADGGKDIKIEYMGKTYGPEDPDFQRVRYIWMSTALYGVVVEQHTVHVHMLNASLCTVKTRTLLKDNHPVYRLLRPFNIKTVAINEHAMHSILGDSGIIYHGAPMTWDSVTALFKIGFDKYRHIPFTQWVEEQGLSEYADSMEKTDIPYVYEGVRAYRLIEDWIEKYVHLYYETDAKVAADGDLVRWYDEIRVNLPPNAGLQKKLKTRKALVEYLATFIWKVTFYHDVTSQTGNSLGDFRFGATFVKKSSKYGSPYPNRQEHFVTMLAHQLTTVESIKVIDNFHHWWLDAEATELALLFQAELWRFKKDLMDRNAERAVSYNNMDPVFIETSVAT